MREWFRRRYLDLLGSIYIYNEHRGYTSIDRILEAVRERTPDDVEFIAAIERHRADERKHYVMFKRWFELQGTMPLNIDRTCGHIDRFVEIMSDVQNRIDALVKNNDIVLFMEERGVTRREGGQWTLAA